MLNLHGVVHTLLKTMRVSSKLSGMFPFFHGMQKRIVTLCSCAFDYVYLFPYRSKPGVNDIVGTGLGTTNTSNALREAKE